MSRTRACVLALAAAALLGSPASADAGSIFSSAVRSELMFGEVPAAQPLSETPADLDDRLAEILPGDGSTAPKRDLLMLDTETVVTGLALDVAAEPITSPVEEEALSTATVRDVRWDPVAPIELCTAPGCPVLDPTWNTGRFISHLVPEFSQVTIDALNARIEGLNSR